MEINANDLWNALKQRCCADPDSAVRISMVSEAQFHAAFMDLTNPKAAPAKAERAPSGVVVVGAAKLGLDKMIVLDEMEPTQRSFAHVFAKAGVFRSVGEARRNGDWSRPAERGVFTFANGRKRVKIV